MNHGFCSLGLGWHGTQGPLWMGFIYRLEKNGMVFKRVFVTWKVKCAICSPEVRGKSCNYVEGHERSITIFPI